MRIRQVTGFVLSGRAAAGALLAGAVLAILCSPGVLAAPQGENVVSGSATFERSGAATTITAGNRAIINYSSFDVAANEAVRFVQPSATATVLNRIQSASPTRIDGALQANGIVYLVNRAGVIFGPGSIVNVGGLYAAAASISNHDFLAGINRFTDAAGDVTNNGTIVADAVGLIGRTVANHGSIVAIDGLVTMVAGKDVLLSEEVGGHLMVRLEGSAEQITDKPGVENTGTIQAPGGKVLMGAGDMFSLAARQAGTVQAKEVAVEGKAGVTEVTGTIDASGQTGGKVTVTGEKVAIKGATIDASGLFGGGVILIGGDYQGANPDVANARQTFVNAGSVLKADAIASGDGGKIIVWADQVTWFYGQAFVRGGPAGGNGGFIETSGKGALYVGPEAVIGLGAPRGTPGTWLLDPTDVTLTAATLNMTGDPTWVPGAGNPVTGTIDIAAIEAVLELGAGGVVSVSTSPGGGAGPLGGRITVTNAITVDYVANGGAASTSTLTLNADADIVVNNTISLSTTDGAGDIFTLNLNATTGVDINAAISNTSGNGKIVLGTTGTTFDNTGGAITTTGGAVDINNTGAVTIGAAINAGAGAVTIDGTGAGAASIGGAGLITTSNTLTLNATGAIGSPSMNLAATGAIVLTSGGNTTFTNSSAVNLGACSIGGNLAVTATTGNITDSGTVTVGGTATFTTSTADADIDLGTLASTGAISVNTNGTTGHATVVNSIALDLAASTVGGNLAVTATAGNITDSGIVTVGGTATFTTSTADADIDLGTLAATGAISVNTNGTTGFATVVNASAVDLAASTVGDDLAVTATTGNITDSGTVTVGGTATFTTSTADADIDLGTLAATGAVSVNTNGTTGHATVVNSIALDLAASTVGGNLAFTATAGSITNSGALVVGGTGNFTVADTQSIHLGNAGNAFTGNVTLNAAGAGALNNVTFTDSGGVSIGTGGSLTFEGGNLSQTGNLVVTATTGNITDSGLITVGGTATFTTSAADADIDLGTLASTGAISVNTNGTTGHATVVNSIALDLAASTVGGNLTVTATAGNITDSGTVTVGGTATFTTGAASADIDLGTLAATGAVSVNTNGANGDATVVNSIALDLAASAVSRNLAVTATTGDITNSGALTVGGTGNFTVADTQSIHLGNAGNTFGGNVTLNAAGAGALNNVTFTDSGGVSIGTSLTFEGGNLSLTGDLTVTATAGNMTDSGTVTVGGTATFTTLANDATIDLGTLAITGTVALNTTGTAGHATIVDNNTVDLAASNVGGNLTVTATAGNITDSGTVTVGGTASFTTSTSGADIDLGTLAVTGTIDLATTGSGGNATIVNATAVDLAAMGIGGNLTVTATLGNITDSGTVTVGGTASFTTSAANATIDLGTLAATGNVTANTNGLTGHATLVNSIALGLAASNVGGNLTATATAGNITDSGTVTVGGTATFTTGTANADIDLDTLAVTGAISVNTSGATGVATIVNASAVDLAASTVGDDLDVTATTGNITDSGTVTVGGTATFTTSFANATINLGTLASTGAVSVNTNGATGDATVVNSIALALGASNVGRNLTVTATTGNITDSGTVTVGGTASFTTSVADDDINLGTLAVTSTIDLSTNGTTGNATIVNATAVDLAAMGIGGNLTVTATTGNITDSGTVTVGGTASFTTSTSGADIDLGTLAVTGTIDLATTGSGGNATIVNATAVDLAAMGIGGNLTVTATLGNITDSGTVTVGGTATFTTSAANATIDLGTLASTGAVSVNTNGATGNVTVVNSIALDLAASTVGGNLTATATTGNITDSGTVTVGGTASFTTSALNADIDLGTLAVTGMIDLSTNGTTGFATVVNASAVDLAASTVGDDLDVTATTGNITDSGTVTVGGTATFTTSAANATIDLGTLASTGAVSVNTNGATGDATVVNSIALALGASNVGRNLTVTATTGNITDSGTVTVGGTAMFTTSTADADIALGTLAVTGTIDLSTNGTTGNATIVNATAVDLAAMGIGGNLAVTATTGNITDSGLITVVGTATFTTSAANADIDLGTLAVTGTIDLATNGATGHATIVNATAVDLAAMGIGGNLAVTATTGNITDSGTVTVGGTATFTTSAADADIDLGTLASTGAISVNTNGTTGNATIANATGSLTFAGVTTGGDFTASASGNLFTTALISTGGGNIALSSTAGSIRIEADLDSRDLTPGNAGDISIQTDRTAMTDVGISSNDWRPDYLIVFGNGTGSITIQADSGAVYGNITINTNGVRPQVPSVATIVGDVGGGNLVFAGENFRMGSLEKMTSTGGIYITRVPTTATFMTLARLSDITAASFIRIRANTIDFLVRDPAIVVAADGTLVGDTGMNLIANSLNVMAGPGGVTYNGAATPGLFPAATGGSPFGIGIFPGTIVAIGPFASVVLDDATNAPPISLSGGASRWGLDGVGLIGFIPPSLSTALASALPSQQVEVSLEQTVDASQQEDLVRHLGIYTKGPTVEELLDYLSGRKFYNDAPDSEYPLSAGDFFGAALLPSDNKVSIDRLPGELAREALAKYREVYWRQSVDPKTDKKIWKSVAGDLRKVIEKSVEDFKAKNDGKFDPVAYRKWVASSADQKEAAELMVQLESLFHKLELLGLGPVEQSISLQMLARSVKPRGLSLQDTINVILNVPAGAAEPVGEQTVTAAK